MKFSVITLFPDMIDNFARSALVGQAVQKGLLGVETINPRDFTSDIHQTVDDRAFGPGDGMVMKVEPLLKAIRSLPPQTRVVVLSPQGRRWTQAEAVEWARVDQNIALVCGRYAGIDQRFLVTTGADEVSIGDFILCGGELAACVLMESVARLKPGVLGNEVSAAQDSFSEGWLECPQFTRPREIEALPVPEPLLSGHHAKIAAFQAAVSQVRTFLLRPDLVPEGFNLKPAAELLKDLPDVQLKSLGVKRADLLEILQ